MGNRLKDLENLRRDNQNAKENYVSNKTQQKARNLQFMLSGFSLTTTIVTITIILLWVHWKTKRTLSKKSETMELIELRNINNPNSPEVSQPMMDTPGTQNRLARLTFF